MKHLMNRPEIPEDHPMIHALRRGDPDLVRRQLESGISPYTCGLVAGAIQTGSDEILQAFLDYGMNLSLPFNEHGETPIFRTIEMKKMKILRYILNKGASVGYDPSGSSTPLYHAAASWPEAIPILLEAGAEVQAKASDGRTPTMAAAHRNQIESLNLLLEAGADLEDKDNDGTTALILAARAGSLEAAEWLLGHGADINSKDKRGKTALDWAKANGHQKIVELLQSRMGGKNGK